MTNHLYYGDNLDVQQRYIADESVDLVYLDPPFNSNASYNVLYAEQDGSRAAAQIKAFEDTWRWDQAAVQAYELIVERGGAVADVMRGLRTFLGDSNMMAYLAMMAPRLVDLRRTMKPSATIYLHCDPTASHYLKLIMDAVFGAKNFLNELIWYYRGAGTPRTAFARRHDVLLVFVKKKGEHYFDPDPIRRPYADATVERFAHSIGNVRGDQDYGQQELNPLGKHPDDVIAHIQPIAPSARARLGYPTQKPIELLKEILLASSQKGDVVLDPFCGCGTTVAAAQELDREWIGIDITHLAINLMRFRLQDSFGEDVADTYEVIGEPVSLPDARDLAADDPYQFQWWSLGLVGARPVEQKKGADRGIDGRLYFHDEPSGGATKQVVLSVKAGKTGVQHVRDLRGVMEREGAQIGVFISLQEPTQPMRAEAASAGTYTSPWGKHPRIQLLTVKQLLAGERIDMPPAGANVTHKRAPRVQKTPAEQAGLFES